jgi:hypothetical protein
MIPSPKSRIVDVTCNEPGYGTVEAMPRQEQAMKCAALVRASRPLCSFSSLCSFFARK